MNAVDEEIPEMFSIGFNEVVTAFVAYRPHQKANLSKAFCAVLISSDIISNAKRSSYTDKYRLMQCA